MTMMKAKKVIFEADGYAGYLVYDIAWSSDDYEAKGWNDCIEELENG